MDDIRNFKKSIESCVVCCHFAVTLAAISVHGRKRVLMATFYPNMWLTQFAFDGNQI